MQDNPVSNRSQPKTKRNEENNKNAVPNTIDSDEEEKDWEQGFADGKVIWYNDVISDLWCYVKNTHVLLGICLSHPKHPFTKLERLIFLFAAFSFCIAYGAFLAKYAHVCKKKHKHCHEQVTFLAVFVFFIGLYFMRKLFTALRNLASWDMAQSKYFILRQLASFMPNIFPIIGILVSS